MKCKACGGEVVELRRFPVHFSKRAVCVDYACAACRRRWSRLVKARRANGKGSNIYVVGRVV